MCHYIATDGFSRISVEHGRRAVHLGDDLVGNYDCDAELCLLFGSMCKSTTKEDNQKEVMTIYLISQPRQHSQELRQVHLPGGQLPTAGVVGSVESGRGVDDQ